MNASDRVEHEPPAVGVVIILLIGAMAIAFAPIFAKLAIQHGNVGASASAFWRVTLAFPVFLMLYGMRRFKNHRTATKPSNFVDHTPRTRSPWRHAWLVVPGLLFGGDLATWHVSFLYTTAANATLLANLQAVIVGFVGWWFLRERLKPVFAVGAALSLAGVAGLLYAGSEPNAAGRNPLIGDSLAIVTAGFYAGYLLSIKYMRRTYPVIEIMTVTCAGSAVVLLLVAIALGEQLTSDTAGGWWALIALALVPHCLGQGLITWTLAKLPASFTAVTLLVQPVAAGGWGWLILGEALSNAQIAAACVVLIGIYLARRGSL